MEKQDLKKKVNKIKKNKGFTLIELIVVIAILGIVVLLSAPKFLGYTASAKAVELKNDLKVQENQMIAELTKQPDTVKTLEIVSDEKIQEIIDSKKGVSSTGEIVSGIEGAAYVMDASKIEGTKTKMSGLYIWSEDYSTEDKDKLEGVIYYDENISPDILSLMSKSNGNSDSTSNGESGNSTGDGTNSGGTTVGEGTGSDDGNTVDLEPAPDTDFEFVREGFGQQQHNGQLGYFKYIGDEETVVIPDVIQGSEVISLKNMFSGNTTVTKVISDNKNIVDLTSMFSWSTKTGVLDLSELDTSNVTSMHELLSSSAYTGVIFGGKFDTSKVKDMERMFQASSIEKIDTTLFDTSSVTDISYMFAQSKATEIIFGENFDTSNVSNMSNAFSNARVLSLDLSHWNTSKAQVATDLFTNTSRLTSLDLSGFSLETILNNHHDLYVYSSISNVIVATQEIADTLNASSTKQVNITYVPKN